MSPMPSISPESPGAAWPHAAAAQPIAKSTVKRARARANAIVKAPSRCRARARRGAGRHGKALRAQVGVDARIAAAEMPVGFRWIERIADAQDVIVIALRDPRIVGSAGLQEGFEGIVVEDLRPQVTVIAGRILIAREHMSELRRAVTHHNFLRHPEGAERVAFEAVRINGRTARQMQLHVDDRAGQILDGLKARIEGMGALDLLHQICGYRLPATIVDAEPAQDF